MKYIVVFLVVLFGCASSPDNQLRGKREVVIDDPHFKGKAELSFTSRGFRIALIDHNNTRTDQAIFNYPPYRFDAADVDRDGRTEVLVGLIKPTEFDPEERKRLFILRIDEGQLRPLWLGSRVCQQLVDFRAQPDGAVRTLEQTRDGHYAVGIYTWQGFGLTLIEYIDNEKSYDEAVHTFNS